MTTSSFPLLLFFFFLLRRKDAGRGGNVCDFASCHEEEEGQPTKRKEEEEEEGRKGEVGDHRKICVIKQRREREGSQFALDSPPLPMPHCTDGERKGMCASYYDSGEKRKGKLHLCSSLKNYWGRIPPLSPTITLAVVLSHA